MSNAVQWFLVNMPFEKIDRKNLCEGLIVYYTIGSKFVGQHAQGPFNVTVKNNKLHLRNPQNVELDLENFTNVEFYAMLTV